jgi:hypothetical protein
MAQRGLGIRRVKMDAHRADALLGTVAVSMAGLARDVRTCTLKMAQWFDDGDEFCSVCMRRR